MDNGGYAFPVPMVARPCGDGTTIVESAYDGGMTMRDYFAAAALTGLLANGDPLMCCEKAYQYADGMLRERDKTCKPSTNAE